MMHVPHRSFRPIATLALAALIGTGLPHAAGAMENADATAKILAGITPDAGSPLASIAQDPSWQRHARSFDASWKRLDTNQLAKVKAWSARNLTDPKPTLLYMFSGPDYLYADAFFQNASTYVLSGLEPVGQIPDLTTLPRGTLSGEISQLQSSLNSVMSYSFFITKKMKSQLAGGRITGTMPVLFVFLARSGKTVKDATHIALDADGGVHDASEPGMEKAAAKGVKITFADPEGREKTLYYFSTDVSNSGTKTSGFLKFAASLGPADAFTKSASYLMHADHFSAVRDTMLTQASTIAQDDSGIPARFFGPEWQLKPYGRYLGPISIFPGRSQPKLAEVYRRNAKGDLGFSIGYRWRPHESNLLVAVKGAAPVTQTEPATVPDKGGGAAGTGEEVKQAAETPKPKKRRRSSSSSDGGWWFGGF